MSTQVRLRVEPLLNTVHLRVKEKYGYTDKIL